MIGAYVISPTDGGVQPSGPTNVVLIPLYAIPSATSVTLKWLPMPTQIRYNVYVNGSFNKTVLDTALGTDGLITATITGLMPNTSYKFTVNDPNTDSGSITATTTAQGSAQTVPVTITVTPASTKPNYLLWAGLAVGAYSLLRKK